MPCYTQGTTSCIDDFAVLGEQARPFQTSGGGDVTIRGIAMKIGRQAVRFTSSRRLRQRGPVGRLVDRVTGKADDTD